MHPETPTRSRQTDYLFLLLGNLGFVVPDETPSTVTEADGYVTNPELGIWVHADNDMIRLVVEGNDDQPDQPGYRLVLGRRGLLPGQAMAIIAVHARAAADQRRG